MAVQEREAACHHGRVESTQGRHGKVTAVSRYVVTYASTGSKRHALVEKAKLMNVISERLCV